MTRVAMAQKTRLPMSRDALGRVLKNRCKHAVVQISVLALPTVVVVSIDNLLVFSV